MSAAAVLDAGISVVPLAIDTAATKEVKSEAKHQSQKMDRSKQTSIELKGGPYNLYKVKENCASEKATHSEMNSRVNKQVAVNTRPDQQNWVMLRAANSAAESGTKPHSAELSKEEPQLGVGNESLEKILFEICKLGSAVEIKSG